MINKHIEALQLKGNIRYRLYQQAVHKIAPDVSAAIEGMKDHEVSGIVKVTFENRVLAGVELVPDGQAGIFTDEEIVECHTKTTVFSAAEFGKMANEFNRSLDSFMLSTKDVEELLAKQIQESLAKACAKAHASGIPKACENILKAAGKDTDKEWKTVRDEVHQRLFSGIDMNRDNASVVTISDRLREALQHLIKEGDECAFENWIRMLVFLRDAERFGVAASDVLDSVLRFCRIPGYDCEKIVSAVEIAIRAAGIAEKSGWPYYEMEAMRFHCFSSVDSMQMGLPERSSVIANYFWHQQLAAKAHDMMEGILKNRQTQGELRTRLLEFAKTLEILLPVTADSVMAAFGLISHLEGREARIGMAIVAGLLAVTGESGVATVKDAVVHGVMIFGGAESFLSACEEISKCTNPDQFQAEKTRIFGDHWKAAVNAIFTPGALPNIRTLIAKLDGVFG